MPKFMEKKFDVEYTEASRDEIAKWFSERMDRLPQKLRLDEGTVVVDVPMAVERLLFQLQKQTPSVIWSGNMAILKKIKQKMEDMG